MYRNMEDWSEIRRRVLVEGVSKRQILRETKLHWVTLKKILAHSEPPGYRQKQPRPQKKLGAFLERIRQILKEDQALPRKQRHTAKRIWERLREAGFTAGYSIVRTAGRFELRDYPALTVVETPMATSGQAADGSFNRLLRFISGQNQAQQKISMTTPVFMSGTATNRAMAFVLPAQLKPAQVPAPTDPAVSVRALPAQRFAVFQFSGSRTSANESAALAQLQEWLAAQSLPTNSTPIYAYFDPPWTPAFLRRNEVMLPVLAQR